MQTTSFDSARHICESQLTFISQGALRHMNQFGLTGWLPKQLLKAHENESRALTTSEINAKLAANKEWPVTVLQRISGTFLPLYIY